MSSFIVIFMTAPDREEAVKIARQLLNDRLIACANIIGPVSSLFWWKGKVEKAKEFLVFMKSRRNLFEKLSARIKEMHSYEVPEIIAVSIIKALPSYLDWLNASLESVSEDD